MSPLKHASAQSFTSDVLQSPVPVLVDFYADWCGPCRRLAPTLERLATEFAGRASIVKVNVDHEPRLADQFQVESLPTLLFFAGGNVIGRTSGLIPEPNLRQALNQFTRHSSPDSRRAG